jgi:uncharacterized protein (DUF1684 family)
MKRSLIAIIALLVAITAFAETEVDPEYRAEIEKWRAGRLERLTADDGWLSVVGLHWLHPGHNRFGSDPSYEVPLAAKGVLGFCGTLRPMKDGRVEMYALANANVTVNGKKATGAMLSSDLEGTPDMVGVGRFSFYVISRSGRLAVRVKDPEAEARKQFEGIGHFPIDSSYRVSARLEPYGEPRQVTINTVIGTPTIMHAPGRLRFTLAGEELSLEPFVEDPENPSYFLMFRDGTSGNTSYGAGRFLYADVVGDDGTTTLDFNRAYNPPCAFTAHATCPLPPPWNTLRIKVEAGEKYKRPKK